MNPTTRNNPSNLPAKNPAVTVKTPKALEVLAGRLSIDPAQLHRTLRDVIFRPGKVDEKPISDEELAAVVLVANTYQLNPILREIYAFRDKRGAIVPVVSVDGWINLVNREDKFDGIEFEFKDNSDGTPFSCICTIYVKGRSHPCRIEEFYEECRRDTGPWNQMPKRMLRHKSLKECGRVAFGFSGIYDEDEARDMGPTEVRVDPSPVFDGPPETRSLPPSASEKPPLASARYQPPIDVKATTQPEPAKIATSEPADEDRVPFEYSEPSEPAPKPAPAAPQTAQDAPKPTNPTEGKANTVNAVLALLEEVGASPEDCLSWMSKMKLIDPAATTLESVPHSKLLEVVAKWPNIKFSVKGAAQ